MTIDSRQLIRIKPCIYYYQIYNNSFRMSVHKHNTLEIMYVSGEGNMGFEYFTEDGGTESITIFPGQLVVVRPNLPHKIFFEDEDDSTIINIEFECRTPFVKIEDLFFNNCLTESMRSAKQLYAAFKDILILTDSHNVLAALLHLQEILTLNYPPQEFELHYTLCISQLILDLMLCENAYKRYSEGNIYINKALTYIRKNLRGALTLESIADAAGCSAVYLNKLFRKMYGQTVAKRLAELRVQRAKYLLQTSGLPIKTIGKAVGFVSAQTFIGNFKTIVGMTPMEYRNNKELEFRHLHAYEHTFFDRKFNCFLSFDMGIMLTNVPFEQSLSEDRCNVVLYNGEARLSDVCDQIENNQKFLFANAALFANGPDRVTEFLRELDALHLSDYFIGFYFDASTTENFSELAAMIQNVSPITRKLLNYSKRDPADSIGSLPPAITDIVLDAALLDDPEHLPDCNRWLKLDSLPERMSDIPSRYLRLPNFGGIIADR